MRVAPAGFRLDPMAELRHHTIKYTWAGSGIAEGHQRPLGSPSPFTFVR